MDIQCRWNFQSVPGATITFAPVLGGQHSVILPPTVTDQTGLYGVAFTNFPGAHGTYQLHFAGNAELEPSTTTASFTVPP